MLYGLALLLFAALAAPVQAHGPDAWHLDCSQRACVARNGPLMLWTDRRGAPVLSSTVPLDGVELHFAGLSYPLTRLLGRPLSPIWQARLAADHGVISLRRSEQTTRISLAGFSDALNRLRSQTGLARPSAPGPLAAMGLADARARGTPGRHIPYTKPQVEFAIRAQNSGDATGLTGDMEPIR